MQCHHRPRLWPFVPGLLVDPAPSADPSWPTAIRLYMLYKDKGRRQLKDQPEELCLFYQHGWSHTLGGGEKVTLRTVSQPICVPFWTWCSHTWSGRIFLRIKCGPLTKPADLLPGLWKSF